MIELALAVAACVVMGKIAATDNHSGIVWGGVCAGLCVGSFFVIPWPFLRVGMAVGAAFVGMIAYKMIASRRG